MRARRFHGRATRSHGRRNDRRNAADRLRAVGVGVVVGVMLNADQIEAARSLAIEELADCDAFEAKGYMMFRDRERYTTILAALDAYSR
jgi:hypothetical protein